MKAFFPIALLGTLLAACEKEFTPEEQKTKTLVLNNCATEGADTTAIICFTSLNDSRCPSNAVCVWAGVAVAKFTLHFGNRQHEITLATSKLPAYPSTDTTVAGYHVKLVNVIPYPGSQVLEPTRAILQITR